MKKIMLFSVFFGIAINIYPMHIMEGFLPIGWSISWFLICIPFWISGIIKIKKMTKESMDKKLILALAGAFIFILSALKIPSVTGSSSHPTGVGLSAILFGPYITSILGTIVLIFQASLLAHGGFTTLGANAFSMAIIGPIISYLIYKLLNKKNHSIAVFLAASFGNLSTYIVTSIQLALAHPSVETGVMGSLLKFLLIFALTQIPLAIIEGLLTNIVINQLSDTNKIEKEVKN